MTTPLTLAQAACQAAPALAALSADVRNRALLCAAETLYARRADIFEANRSDLARAREQHLAAPLLSRLRFDEAKLRTVLDGLQALAALPDPLGCTLLATQLAPGLDLYRVSCPIGVIGVIFESRPDALVQIASSRAATRRCSRAAAKPTPPTARSLPRCRRRPCAAACPRARWACCTRART